MHIEDVFTTSGIPQYTYVEPKEYRELFVSIRTPGRCVVIEGPSGIGKTTAIQKVIKDLDGFSQCQLFSARKSGDIESIEKIAQGEFTGIAIIDDFHRLADSVRQTISDTMKVLADESDDKRKIVAIGINRVGDSLVKFSPDLNNRITTIHFETNSDEKIEELIELGEKALNIRFLHRQNIVENALGSFHLAQLLCYRACILGNIIDTQETNIEVNISAGEILNGMYDELSRTFLDVAKGFATGPRLRQEGRAPYLHVLKWLAESDTWTIFLSNELARHPEQKASVSQIVEKGYLYSFLEANPNINKHICFDNTTHALSVEDPKFMLFLKLINWNQFAKKIGFLQIYFEPRYDYALSFSGSIRPIVEKIYYRLASREIAIFYDKNEQSNILAQNVEDYLFPIYSSDSKYVIAFLSKDYPTRVWTRFESRAFKDRFGDNAVIPIWFSDVDRNVFDKSSEYGGFELKVDGIKDIDSQIEEFVDLLCEKIKDIRNMQLSIAEILE